MLRTVTRTAGELMITLGLVVLLFVGYEVHLTGWITKGRQQEATVALEGRWGRSGAAHDRLAEPGQTQRLVPRQEPEPAREGEGIVRLFAPALGPDFAVTVLEGTGPDTLAAGPGHYTGTALPGQPGNFAVAGHRVGNGAPFDDLDLLESCDALVVESATEWFVYRVLPMTDEIPGWERDKGTEPRCAAVTPLPAPYPVVPGREIVSPSDGTVIAAVPGQPRDAAAPADARAQLITLTTCHPKFSARQRLIVHGVLVAQYLKGGDRPAELVGG